MGSRHGRYSGAQRCCCRRFKKAKAAYLDVSDKHLSLSDKASEDKHKESVAKFLEVRDTMRVNALEYAEMLNDVTQLRPVLHAKAVSK